MIKIKQVDDRVSQQSRRPNLKAMSERILRELTASEVAERYGYEPNRAGFIECPFHSGDHTASLKLYPGNRGWYCFGCHAGGSVIDFVMRLYSESWKDAVLRLNGDFFHGDAMTTEEEVMRLREANRNAKLRNEIEGRISELDQIAWDCTPIKRAYGERVAKGEEFYRDPSGAPDWWINAVLGLQWIDDLLLSVEIQIAELRERERGEQIGPSGEPDG